MILVVLPNNKAGHPTIGNITYFCNNGIARWS